MTFSVVIPVYNIAPYVRATLDSVWTAARGHRVELLCVDDGSSDGSLAVLQSFAAEKRSERGGATVRILSQANAGVSAARNAAMAVATGEYLCFVDGDDTVVPEYFQVLTSCLVETSADIVGFNGIGGTFETFVGSAIAWNACYRREALGDLRFEPIPNGEDILFAAEAFCRARRVASVPDRLYQYARREGSAVHTASLRHLKSVCDMVALLKVRVGPWANRHGQGRHLRKQLRNSIEGEAMSVLSGLTGADCEKGWQLVFQALREGAWGRVPQFLAWSRSRFLTALLLLGEKKFRNEVSAWRDRLLRRN